MTNKLYSGARVTLRIGYLGDLPPEGCPVTIVRHHPVRFLRGTVEAPVKLPDGISGFRVALLPEWRDLVEELNGNEKAAHQHNLWSLDPDSAEGVGWCRGWEGETVDAFKAAVALR